MQKKDAALCRQLSFIEAIALSIDLSPFSSIDGDQKQEKQSEKGTMNTL